MILHLFTQVSEYSLEFIRLLADEFDPSEHLVVFRNRANAEKVNQTGIDVRFIESRQELISQLPLLLEKSSKIIFHSFPVSRSLLFWYRHRKYMQKAAWFVWGHDAYWFRYCKKTLSNRLYEVIRAILIRKLETIISPISGDYEYVVNHYKTKAPLIKCRYPVPTDFELLKSLRNRSDNETVNIQLGNSANPTNNLEELIQFFGKYEKAANFHFHCLLSYGDMKYAEKIIDLGKSVLGNRFFPETRFMNRTEFANYISTIDVLIMNHQRQQGLGNIISFLYLGKKVYIRSDNSLYSLFKENEITVYDTIELLYSGDTKNLLEVDSDTISENIIKTENFISHDRITLEWQQVFHVN
ncbi:MAG TPA: TDP-N-acetylfucosamine:lipid II N-acetylfucosaminyltransferase [Bacteroidales bacterium]|nr:TDP-N-acetylfucosamine:lipid II N-acetylfucosaminyltransferase [Bacteroidales bacterium]